MAVDWLVDEYDVLVSIIVPPEIGEEIDDCLLFSMLCGMSNEKFLISSVMSSRELNLQSDPLTLVFM